jgi:hypothetical protein
LSNEPILRDDHDDDDDVVGFAFAPPGMPGGSGVPQPGVLHGITLPIAKSSVGRSTLGDKVICGALTLNSDEPVAIDRGMVDVGARTG